MQFRAENGAILKQIALLRANQIARITSDFKMDLINRKSGYKPEEWKWPEEALTQITPLRPMLISNPTCHA